MTQARRQDNSTGEGAVRQRELSARVRLVQTNERVQLSVKGSLLVCEQRRAVQTAEVCTPLEQVHFLQPGRHATSAQWALFLIFNSLLAMFPVLRLTDRGALEDPSAWKAFALMCGVLACSVLFGLWWLKRGRPMARLRLGDQGPVLEFWHRPGRDKELDLFFAGLQRAQATVDEQAETGAVARVTPRKAYRLRQFAAGTVFFLLVGVAVGDHVGSFWPLLLGAIPSIGYIVGVFMRLREPRALRLGRSCWARGKLDDAAKWLDAFLAEHPHHVGAWHILLQVHVLSGRHEEALECSKAMQSLRLIDRAQAEALEEHVAAWQEIDRRRK